MNWRGFALSRWRLFRNTFFGRRRVRTSRAQRSLFSVVVIALMVAVIYAGFAAAFAGLAEAGAGARECGVLLGLILGAAAVATLVFDVHEMVAAVVAESDLQLLRAAPLAPSQVFAIKLVDAAPRTSIVLLMIAVPALVGFARVHPIALWGWVALVPALLGLWLIPLGLGSAAALLILRGVPARFVREAMRLVTTFFVLGLWLGNLFVLPRLIDRAPDALGWLGGAAVEAPPAYRASPGSWVASVAVAGATRAPASLAGPLAGLVIGAALALGLAAGSAAVNLPVVQARLIGAGDRHGPVTSRRPRQRLKPRGFLGSMLVRDARLLRREWAVFADVLITAALWMLFPLVAVSLRGIDPPMLLRAMLLSLAVGLGYEVGARALPFERRGLVWARLAPVPSLQWTLARWLGTLALALPLTIISALIVGRLLDLPFAESRSALGQALPALVLSLSIGLWTGGRFGNPDWTHQRAMLSVTGRVVAILLMFAQGIGWIAWVQIGSPAGALVPLLAALGSLLALHAAARALRRPLI